MRPDTGAGLEQKIQKVEEWACRSSQQVWQDAFQLALVSGEELLLPLFQYTPYLCP